MDKSSDEMFNPATITQESNEINGRAIFPHHILIKNKYIFRYRIIIIRIVYVHLRGKLFIRY